MTRYFCHDYPDVLILEARVLDARPGAVVLDQSPFHPGGGGQLADRGTLGWHGGEVSVTGLDAAFRSMMAQLHTDTHILNALVFRQFQGALVTGAQLNEDGTARMDFDLPEADNDRLRALEPEINDVIRQDLPVRYAYVTEADVLAERGLVRNRSVAPPPTEDGTIRVVEIVGLDRQACGGTHLASTAGSRPLGILKIDNKGRHNRRIKIGLAGLAPR